jgi:hypothetical protein
MGGTGDLVSDDEEKGRAAPVDTGTNLNEIRKLLEKEETCIDMLLR